MAPIDKLSLTVAEQDYRDSQERAKELRAFRDELVQKAVSEGWTHAQIAEATGLTRARVGQIALQQ